MGNAVIQVYFNPIQAGEPRPSKDLWAPMIKVSLIIPTKVGVDQIVSNIAGMIDTGSDHARIDDDLAAKYGLTSMGTVQSHGMGAATTVPTYNCGVIFDEGARLMVGFAGYAFRRENNDFDLLLGMQVLQHFEFSLAAAAQKATLRFLG
jgi:hypothetical protein